MSGRIERKNRLLVTLCLSWVLVCWNGFAQTSQEVGKEIAPGVLFEKNVPIPTRDGSVVMANVFRPAAEGNYPVVMSMSAYAKDLHTKVLHAKSWEDMLARVPGLLDNSSGDFHNWEVYDPEVWVPYGYVIVRVDSRGSGKSPGHLFPMSLKESEDYYDAIEWAGTQSWSNGKVGMAGISYFAMIQWKVAATQPPHLAGFIPWEGASDTARDAGRHGGILSNTFASLWWGRAIIPVQHGNARLKDADDGAPLGGPVSLSPAELAANRTNPLAYAANLPIDDPFITDRNADFSKIKAPFLSAANWGAMGLHLRGNFEGFVRSASEQKWLETHGSDHVIPFYSEEGQALQKEFFDYFLKGENNGWDDRPPVILRVRHPGEKFELREENEWPLARTEWTRFAMDASSNGLGVDPITEAKVSYQAMKEAVTFRTLPFEETTEITGPVMANLWVSSSTSDMDIFATLQLFDPEGEEVTVEGTSDPAAAIAQGWLRATHRKLDESMSTPYRPYHSHDDIQPMVPGKAYEVQVEIWPTSIVVPEGYSLALRLEGKDFSRAASGAGIFTGSGHFLHNDPKDRPSDIFGGINSIHTGGEYDSYLQLPVIP